MGIGLLMVTEMNEKSSINGSQHLMAYSARFFEGRGRGLFRVIEFYRLRPASQARYQHMPAICTLLDLALKSCKYHISKILRKSIVIFESVSSPFLNYLQIMNVDLKNLPNFFQKPFLEGGRQYQALPYRPK